MRIVVMGVSASGKTTVGERLASRLHARFVDADAAHPPENVAKMAAGVPLTDHDRWPWLRTLRDELAASESIVITCSALKRSYRDVLREAGDVTFVFLDVDPATVDGRIRARTDHFMKADMVASQFADLERPTATETDVLVVDGTGTIDDVVDTLADRFDAA